MFGRFASVLPGPLKTLAVRFDRSPIESTEALIEFVQTRSSYIAQTSLYGYLKTRMGTQFARYFEDDVFSVSIRVAAAKVFAACLADLTVFAVARVASDGGLKAVEAAELARDSYQDALKRGLSDMEADETIADALSGFDQRIERTHWANAAQGAGDFSGSEEALIGHAPVIDEFKELDREIVTNSIRFRWRDVRVQLSKRIDSAGICADWRSRSRA